MTNDEAGPGPAEGRAAAGAVEPTPAGSAKRPDAPSTGSPVTGSSSPAPDALEDAARHLRAPGMAGVAGLLFAVSFTAGLVLLRDQPLAHVGDTDVVGLLGSRAQDGAFVGGLYLAPFAGIMFLWFMAVVRDRVGVREDRFFETVFLGSGILFVALFFVAAAVSSALIVSVRELGQADPTRRDVELIRSMSYTILFGFGTRAGAVFLLATSSLAHRTGALPRPIVLLGVVAGLVLFVVVSFWDWIVLVIPAWVAIVSLYVLWQRRSRRA